MEIRHDRRSRRFFGLMEGRECVLSYTEAGNVWEFHHVYVPEELRGRGLAGELTAHAFRTAEAEGRRVRPICGYVRAFVERHPEWLRICV